METLDAVIHTYRAASEAFHTGSTSKRHPRWLGGWCVSADPWTWGAWAVVDGAEGPLVVEVSGSAVTGSTSRRNGSVKWFSPNFGHRHRALTPRSACRAFGRMHTPQSAAID